MPEERGCEDSSLIFRSTIVENDMNILQASTAGDGSCGMPMKFAEVGSETTLSIDVEVSLTAEEYDASDRDEASQIILLGVRESCQINAMDLGAKLGITVDDVGCRGEQVSEVRIAMDTFVMVGYFVQGIPVEVGEGWTEVLMLVKLIMGLNRRPSRFIRDRFLDFHTPTPGGILVTEIIVTGPRSDGIVGSNHAWSHT